MTHPSLHWGEVSPESESTPAAVRNQNSEVRDQLVLWSGLMTCQLINHEHMSIGCLSHHHQSLSELWLCHNQDSAQNFCTQIVITETLKVSRLLFCCYIPWPSSGMTHPSLHWGEVSPKKRKHPCCREMLWRKRLLHLPWTPNWPKEPPGISSTTTCTTVGHQ